MITYHPRLYLTEKTEKKIDTIKWKLGAGAGMVQVHLITLAQNEADVFDIYPAALFKQHNFRRRDYVVVGIAESKEAAMSLVRQMIEDCAKRSGSYEQLRAQFTAEQSTKQVE